MASKEQGEEVSVMCEGACVSYPSTDKETVLATLEEMAAWDFSEVCQKLGAGRRKGAVDIFELLEWTWFVWCLLVTFGLA